MPLPWLSLGEGTRGGVAGAGGTVGKEPAQMEGPSEELGSYPDGSGEPQKDCKQKRAPADLPVTVSSRLMWMMT